MRVLLHNWRDLHHPEAGGAERYLVHVAEGLATRGHDVTFRTAAYPGALPDETVDGVRYVRRGGHYSMYPRALAATAGSRPDIVVDVQNGVPYLSPLATRAQVVNLVHHVHREQWPVVFGPRTARAGWWVESRLGPAVYRRNRYVAVSGATRDELVGLGIPADRVTVIHNGTDASAVDAPRSPTPRVVVLGRLVPQKRVEVAVSAIAALREEIPDLELDVVGTGWWEPQVHEHVRALGLEEAVTLHGYVSEAEKHRLLARAWVHALPSLKEGWGLVVVEAGIHETPTVAFRDAGGPADSVLDGRTGLLVDGPVEGTASAAFTAAVRRMLLDGALRERTARAARVYATRFSWDDTVLAWERLLTEEVVRRGGGGVGRGGPA